MHRHHDILLLVTRSARGAVAARSSMLSHLSGLVRSAPPQQVRIDAPGGEQLRVPPGNVRVEPPALDVDEVLQHALRGREPVEVPVHRRLRERLVVGHVQRLVVGQLDDIRHAGSLQGVEGEHLLDRGDGGCAGLGVDRLPRLPGAMRHFVDEAPGWALRGKPLQVLLRGRPNHSDDLLDLVQVVPAGEDGLAADELAQDAPDRPHVDGL
mmetsp:Transcript_28038/g.87371  ORF Transcript_28038/g.87371 Transcript_28038/m.87371 type:complete len:210 (+) Transcript_28038:73-702(+)